MHGRQSVAHDEMGRGEMDDTHTKKRRKQRTLHAPRSPWPDVAPCPGCRRTHLQGSDRPQGRGVGRSAAGSSWVVRRGEGKRRIKWGAMKLEEGKGRGREGGLANLTNFLMVGMSKPPSALCVTLTPWAAFAFMWTPITCRAIPRSLSSSRTSRTIKIRSNRDKMVVIKSMFSAADFKSS